MYKLNKWVDMPLLGVVLLIVIPGTIPLLLIGLLVTKLMKWKGNAWDK